MSSTASQSNTIPREAIPPLLLNSCLVLILCNAVMILAMYFAHLWLFDLKWRRHRHRLRQCLGCRQAGTAGAPRAGLGLAHP